MDSQPACFIAVRKGRGGRQLKIEIIRIMNSRGLSKLYKYIKHALKDLFVFVSLQGNSATRDAGRTQVYLTNYLNTEISNILNISHRAIKVCRRIQRIIITLSSILGGTMAEIRCCITASIYWRGLDFVKFSSTSLSQL